MGNLICPNTSICSIYNLRGEKNITCIKDDGEDYSCGVSESFNYSGNLEEFNMSNDKKPVCALIELLNNSRKL